MRWRKSSKLSGRIETPGAAPFLAVTAEDNDWPIKFLEEARGDDSNDADMPWRLTVDNHEISRSIGPCPNAAQRLFQNAALDLLALAILGIELASDRAG